MGDDDVLMGGDAKEVEQGNTNLQEVARLLLAKQRLYDSDDDLATEDDCIFDYLDKSTDKAEARLAARRQARAEAREIRMRELERQQKEIEENADRVYDMCTDPVSRTSRVAATAVVASPRLSATLANNSFQSSRRSSEDSLEETGNVRDIRHELKEVEEKFRKAMIQNAQLDNEKASLNYQVELFKDRLEDLEEAHSQLQREHKEKCRALEQCKRANVKLGEDATCYKLQLEERDELIANHGLQIVGGEEGDTKRYLVTAEHADLLRDVGEGSLDVRLRRLREERDDLADEVRRLQLALEEGRSQSEQSRPAGGGATVNGTDSEEAQRETNKLLADYRFKLQKAEQDGATLQANVARLESQVIRYKGASESSEKVEDELKVEKRKLQREENPDDSDEENTTNDVVDISRSSNDNRSNDIVGSDIADNVGTPGENDDFWGEDDSAKGPVSGTDLADSNKSLSEDVFVESTVDFWADNDGTNDKDVVCNDGNTVVNGDDGSSKDAIVNDDEIKDSVSHEGSSSEVLDCELCSDEVINKNSKRSNDVFENNGDITAGEPSVDVRDNTVSNLDDNVISKTGSKSVVNESPAVKDDSADDSSESSEDEESSAT